MAELERLARRAWPALESERIGGWEVRYSRGFTKRANSVQPVGAPDGTLEDVISRCERWYSDRGRPCIFRLTPLSDPELEPHLEDAGYELIEVTSVLDRPIAQQPEGPELMELDPEGWLQEYARLSNLDDASRDAMGEIVSRIEEPRCLAALSSQGTDGYVACGMAITEGGRVGLFDLVTDRDYRRKGYGRQLVNGLLRWGYQHGAREAYLQVVRANRPAWGLYEKLGFVPRYDYRYRVGGHVV